MALSGLTSTIFCLSAFGGGLNGSTRHSILKGKDGVFGNASRLFSRLYDVGHGPTSCRGVTTSNRRTLLYAQPSRRATCESLGQT
jgi:hypothetical protein